MQSGIGRYPAPALFCRMPAEEMYTPYRLSVDLLDITYYEMFGFRACETEKCYEKRSAFPCAACTISRPALRPLKIAGAIPAMGTQVFFGHANGSDQII